MGQFCVRKGGGGHGIYELFVKKHISSFWQESFAFFIKLFLSRKQPEKDQLKKNVLHLCLLAFLSCKLISCEVSEIVP